MKRSMSFLGFVGGLGAALLGALALASHSRAERETPNAERELGIVEWRRDLPAALAESQSTGKPVMLLFQEVPGCATCVGFGEGALSHPLVVEGAETEFIPVLVYNNRRGRDAEWLKHFGEPSWNNPVVRFLDGDGADVIPRRDRVYTTPALATRMNEALEASGRASADYLGWVDPLVGTPRERVTLETHCFWEGEACIGNHPAVTATRASWDGGREVVEVWFDPAKSNAQALLAHARQRGCGEKVVIHGPAQQTAARASYGRAVRASSDVPRPAKASDQKRHLRASKYRDLPLTRLQQARVNAALAQGIDPARWLSPRQRAALAN